MWPRGSSAFSFNFEDAIKVAKGALIAAAGAALAYATEWVTGTDLGTWGPLVTAGLALVTYAFRKWAFPQ